MDIFTTIISGILIAAVSSWITVQLSVRRFRSEKWWERRVESYIRVIEAFHDSKAFTDAHWEAACRGNEISEKREGELRARADKASKEIRRAIDLSGFFLSDQARERLGKYQKEAAEASVTTDWHRYLELDMDVTESCLRDLINIARKDLRVR